MIGVSPYIERIISYSLLTLTFIVIQIAMQIVTSKYTWIHESIRVSFVFDCVCWTKRGTFHIYQEAHFYRYIYSRGQSRQYNGSETTSERIQKLFVFNDTPFLQIEIESKRNATAAQIWNDEYIYSIFPSCWEYIRTWKEWRNVWYRYRMSLSWCIQYTDVERTIVKRKTHTKNALFDNRCRCRWFASICRWDVFIRECCWIPLHDLSTHD
jgi:hypothetical protein